MTNSQQVSKIYRSVIEEVIKNAREYFLNEGVDEQVLQELKQIWESKLLQSHAVDGISGETQAVQRPTQYLYPHTATQQQLAPTTTLQHQQLQQQHQQQQQQHQQQRVNTVTMAPSQMNMTQVQQLPVVRVPERVTAQQANSGQTAILFPHQGTSHAHTTHGHAIPNMTPAAAAGTMAAIPGMQQVHANPTGVQYQANYPHVKTIQTVPHVQQLHHQQVRTSQDPNSQPHVIQVDGVGDSDSDDDDDDDEEGDEANDHIIDQLQRGEDPEEDDPLNSEDDVSDEEESTDLFDTDNVVVCQFDKIARSRNKWKFHLKDGIMNLKGKDFVFQKAVGEAEW